MFQYAFYLSKLHRGCDVVPVISMFRGENVAVMHNGLELEIVFNLNLSVVFYSNCFSQFLILRALRNKMNC